jgi:hypothetical protein
VAKASPKPRPPGDGLLPQKLQLAIGRRISRALELAIGGAICGALLGSVLYVVSPWAVSGEFLYFAGGFALWAAIGGVIIGLLTRA